MDDQMKNTIRQNIITTIIADLISKKMLFASRVKDFDTIELNNPLNYEFIFFPIRSNYFTVFDNLTNNLGYINNEELKSDIILTYSELKGLFDSLQALEDISKKAQNIPPHTNDPLLSQLAATHYAYANKVLTQMFPDVLKRMDDLENKLNLYKQKSLTQILKNLLKQMVPKFRFNK